MSAHITGSVTRSSKFSAEVTGVDNATGSYSVTSGQTYSTGNPLTKVYTAAIDVNTTANIDLTSVTNLVVGSETFGTLVELHIQNTSQTATLTVGGGTNAVLNQLPVIPPGGGVCLTTATTVDGTHKVIALSGTARLTANVLILGS